MTAEGAVPGKSSETAKDQHEMIGVGSRGPGAPFRRTTHPDAQWFGNAGLGLFIFQNTDDTKVNFLWMDGDIPLFLLLLITVALTLVLAMVATWLLRRRQG